MEPYHSNCHTIVPRSFGPWRVVVTTQLLVLTLLGPVGKMALAQSGPTATVAFHVVDVFGNSLPYRVTAFVSSGPHVDLATRFAGLRGAQIPYGKYDFRVTRSDHPAIGRFEGAVVVDQEEVSQTLVYHGVLVVTGVHVAEALQAKPAGFVMRGAIQPPPKAHQELWVRIQSLYEQSGVEALVEENGEFRIQHFLRGNYAIFVFDHGTLVHSGFATIRPRTETPAPFVVDTSKPIADPIIIE